MACKSCGSNNKQKFSAEVAIHSPGLKNINKPTIVFPELLICLSCGIAEFAIPETELRMLAKDAGTIDRHPDRVA
jgi:hypothetical protein